ncbi:HTTM domain-containing protein [Rhodovulum sp. DZ06]|uniref:HTTM domain-containing protein n=1 Tax=Rhodovulum sp. DZ06 TaxID=3425126 RepID=UPI003D335B85
MTFELAQRLTEAMMALCFLQQGAEHMRGFRDERLLHLPRMGLAALLLAGIAPAYALLGLLACGLALLRRFDGPYNGGSDKMSLLILSCLCAARWAPDPVLAQTALAYLAVQLTLSYFISGWVKVWNREWRSGRALVDVFRFSAYPVSTALRGWADRPGALRLAGWGVIGFELAFPFALLHPLALAPALLVTGSFHFSNACFFGLNRFFWIWISAYPSIWWAQGRIVQALL